MKKNLNKSILITGGTGSFGKAFIKYTLNNFKNIKETSLNIMIFQKFIQRKNIIL